MFLVCKQDFDLVLIIDKNIEDLIETNIRQRGIGNPNPIKLGRCIKELERIYGVRKGSAGQSEPKLSGGGCFISVRYCRNDWYFCRYASEKFSVPTTQSDYYEGFGIDERTACNYKKLTELVPELQDWVETGIVRGDTLQ